MNEYDRKYAAALTELAANDVKVTGTISSYKRAMGLIGVNVRAPYYSTFWQIAVGLALWFGVSWGVLMWFIHWRGDGVSVLAALVSSALAGAFFGVIMGAVYNRTRRKLNLSRWEDL